MQWIGWRYLNWRARLEVLLWLMAPLLVMSAGVMPLVWVVARSGSGSDRTAVWQVAGIDGERLTLVLVRPGMTDQRLTVRLVGIRSRGRNGSVAGAIERWASGGGVQFVKVSAARAQPTAGYVYLADGRMLNRLLLEQGLVLADRSDMHRLSVWFERLERRAGG